jgi:hypothetical protein
MVANAGVWVPRVGSTWGYDSPREFADLAGSMHHAGGDQRLGEVTSPFNNSIYGQDRGNDAKVPDGASLQPDFLIRTGGPLAVKTHANFGFDAGNVQNFEIETWRRDGANLTGPTGGSSGAGRHVRIPYTADHRDVNLDGLIDQGETVPKDSESYSVDDVGITINGGPTVFDHYPYNWQRYIEDNMQVHDYVENFTSMMWNFKPTRDDPVIRFRDQLPNMAVGQAIPGVVRGHANGYPHSSYVTGDSLWIDSNNNGVYDGDTILNQVTTNVYTYGVTVGTGVLNARFHSASGSVNFNASTDDAWVDNGPNAGVYDSEFVLADSGSLMVGDLGKRIDAYTNSIRVCFVHHGPRRQLRPGR